MLVVDGGQNVHVGKQATERGLRVLHRIALGIPPAARSPNGLRCHGRLHVGTHADAATAGAETVQAFADAAQGKVGVVAAAFAKVAAAAKAALALAGGIDGYATGTENAERGFKLVGENGPELVFFNGGEKVLNAQETEAYQRDNTVEAEPMAALPANGGTGGPHIEVKPVYNLSGNMDTEEVRSMLDEQTGRIKEMVEEALEEASKYEDKEIYVIGGASIYKQFLPYCTKAIITKIDHAYEADAYFPNLDKDSEWEIEEESDEQTYFDLAYTFTTYVRK